MDFFYLKKLIARVGFPMPLVLLLLLAGGLLLLLRPAKTPRSEAWRSEAWRRRCGIGFMTAGIVLLAIGAFFGSALLRAYSRPIHPLSARELAAAGTPLVIGVTSAGGLVPGEVPVTEWRIPAESRMRLDEGCRLFAECERAGIPCRLAVSAPGRKLSEERIAATHAVGARYGIAPERIDFVPGVLNSRDEVREFARIPGRLILVSCAAHLPRLLRLARQFGKVDALGSSYDIPEAGAVTPLTFVPSAESFEDFECLIYELLGQAEIFLFH